MGWSYIDNEIERLRETFDADPAAARRRIVELIERTKSASGRCRLWGLLIRVCRRQEDPEGGLRACREGRRLRGSAPPAPAPNPDRGDPIGF